MKIPQMNHQIMFISQELLLDMLFIFFDLILQSSLH